MENTEGSYNPYSLCRILASILHPIGLASCIIILCVLFAMLIVDYKLVHRTTTRYVVGVTVANLLATATDYAATDNPGLAGSLSCQVLIIARAFTYFFQPLVNLSMTNHLYRTHINHHLTTPIYEIIAWALMIFLIGIFMIIMYCIGLFNLYKYSKVCNPTSNSLEVNRLLAGILLFINLMCMIYALSCFIFGTISLNRRRHTARYSFEADKREIHGYTIKMRLIAKRLFYYPLVTVVSLCGQCCIFGMILSGHFVEDLFPLKSVTIGLSGLLTLIVFCRDPTTKITLKIFIYEVKNRLTGN